MPAPLRILTVVGARPQFIKAAALHRAVLGPFADRISNTLLHTGQHYDAGMSQVFFAELGLGRPTALSAPRSDAARMGRMLAGVEAELRRNGPDIVVVYGDTTSTLAGTLAARRCGIDVAHIEAGLRSYDAFMPEEENRVITDHASTWLFCPTSTAARNLAQEGIVDMDAPMHTSRSPGVFNVGDVMLDNALYYLPKARSGSVLTDLGLKYGSFMVATVHRASTADDQVLLRAIFKAFVELASATGSDIVVPLHPRTARTLTAIGAGDMPGLRIVPPMGYLDMLALVDASRLVLTDSGGLQKEAYFLGKRCAILRDSTEWPELLGEGGSMLVGTERERIIAECIMMLKSPSCTTPELFGDGHAAERICNELLRAR